MALDLHQSIAAVGALNLPSAAKHVLIVLLARQHAGEEEYPGSEALTIDTSIPRSLVELSVTTLRKKGLLRLARARAGGEYQFKVLTRTLEQVAYGRAES
jgi:DNA-binding IscR family transcriptional regulator